MEPVSLIFLGAVIGVFVFEVGVPIGRWGQNNRQPVESTKARLIAKWLKMNIVVAKRCDYYCKFETKEGDFPVMRVSEAEYKRWHVGYVGILIYQGSRYHGFQWQPGEENSPL